MTQRREVLLRSGQLAALLAGAGLLPTHVQAAWNAAAFETSTLAELAKTLGASAPTESRGITVTGPDVAENGAAVQLALSTTLPGVKKLMLLVEKNPNVLAASFDVSEAVEAAFTLRVKMGQSSKVIAVALMNDNRMLFAQREVRVTLGGCGG